MLRIVLTIAGAYLGLGVLALAVLAIVSLYRRRIARAVALGAAVQLAIASRRQELEREAFQRALEEHAQPPQSLSRGDFCDVVDAPFNAIVQCVDGETAWCRIVKSQERASGVLVVELVGPPRPFHSERLRVMAHGFALTSAS